MVEASKLPKSLQKRTDDPDAKKREMEQTIVTIIKNLDANAANAKLDQLISKWRLGDTTATFEEQTINMFTCFDIDFNDDMLDTIVKDRGFYGLQELNGKIVYAELEAVGLYHRLRELNLLPNKMDTTEEKHVVLKKITKLLEMIFYAKKIVLSSVQAKLAVHQLNIDDGILELDADIETELGAWALRFRFVDNDTSQFQELLLFLLDSAMEKKYRKYNGWMYEPVVIDGRDMHSWRPVYEIKDFVYSRLKKEISWEMWKNATQNMKNVSSAIEYLTNCHDYQLPNLHKMRGVYSFMNGVYIAEEDRFYKFTDPEPLSDSIVSCKFVEGMFDDTEYEHWSDIPTPHIETVMNFQEWEPEVQKWLFALLGRLLYPVGSCDQWQVVPFFRGSASSGKCFCADTSILMYDGSKKMIQDVLVGDTVMGDDSTPRHVLTLARGEDELFDIVPRNKRHETITVTREHVLCLKFSNQGAISNWKYGKIVAFFDPVDMKSKVKKFTKMNEFDAFVKTIDRDQTFEMTVDEYVNLPTYVRKYFKAYHVKRVEFPYIDPPTFDPWLVGMWLGDGNSAGTRFTNIDQELIDRVGEIAFKCGMKVNKTSGKYQYNIAIDDNSKRNAFKIYLDENDLTNNKHIPENIKRGSRETRLAVLAGLIDTDGHLKVDKSGKNVGGYEIVQKNERLADDIVFVAKSLGFGATKKQVIKTCVYKGNRIPGTYYRMFISGDNLGDLPVAIPRKKYAKTTKNRKNFSRYGVDVVSAGRMDYYGFETDGNHRFVMGNFTVTHNSTLTLKVCKNFFETVDVGILSNNIERKFGISAFHDKYLVVAPEIKNDLAMEQAEFQSMVSGEDVQVAVKHQKAFSTEWDVPMVLAGNEVPGWADNAGSIQRRIVLFEFNKTVTSGDMKLGEKLNAELPNLLRKCNKAYMEMAGKYSDYNIWSVLPSYFHDTRDALARATNFVENYLGSSHVEYGDHFITFEEFKNSLKEHASLNALHIRAFTDDIFTAPFEKYKIKLTAQEKRMINGVEVTSQFVCGLRVRVQTSTVSGSSF